MSVTYFMIAKNFCMKERKPLAVYSVFELLHFKTNCMTEEFTTLFHKCKISLPFYRLHIANGNNKKGNG